jgi:hypothetical protein
MPGKPANLASIKKELLADITSAETLVVSVRKLGAVNPKAANRMHPKHVRRVVELAFMGVVAAWEEFLELVFVRYLAGASAPNGFAPVLRAGKATSVSHAYQVVAQKPSFDVTKDYLKFSDPAWTVAQARFFFDGGRPFDSLTNSTSLFQHASAIRNRVAHSSAKCRADFRATAIAFLQPPHGKLTQGYRCGDLLLSQALRHFGQRVVQKKLTIFEAYMALFRTLADRIVP